VDVTSFLKSLSEANGVSGYEDAVRDIVREQFEALADVVRTDTMGNLIALKRGTQTDEPRRRLMLAAHMDEIGLIVTRVDKGFLRFTQVGGYDPRTLPGLEVTVHGKRPLHGVIGSRPPHVLPATERRKPTPMADLFIDVGLPPEEVTELVQVGDLVTARGRFVALKNDRYSGKAMDDRAGVAAVAVCLDVLHAMRHEWDVFAVATVQEEVGLRGAFTSTYGVMPDIGIAIAVGFARQPGVAEPDAIDLYKGPALAQGPNIHPILFEMLKTTAKEHEIPFQTEIAPGGTGTDANAMQITREGIPTALLSIPLRNMHTAIETLCIRDVTRTGRILAAFAAGLGPGAMAKLEWDAADDDAAAAEKTDT